MKLACHCGIFLVKLSLAVNIALASRIGILITIATTIKSNGNAIDKQSEIWGTEIKTSNENSSAYNTIATSTKPILYWCHVGLVDRLSHQSLRTRLP